VFRAQSKRYEVITVVPDERFPLRISRATFGETLQPCDKDVLYIGKSEPPQRDIICGSYQTLLPPTCGKDPRLESSKLDAEKFQYSDQICNIA
jgi:hypothetical protein